VPDAEDFCPTEAEDADGCDDEDGCPDRDDDHDGVADVADRCPRTRGSPTNDGCPLPPPPGGRIVVSTIRCPILRQIDFAPGQAALTPEAKVVLEDTASVMTEFPEALIIEITARAGQSERGSDLAERRAEVVRSGLVARGIDPRRLRIKAERMSGPTGARESLASRQSRRAEFRVARSLTCPNVNP
jgi:outer membrane protein OmpA-like peptidoglycan-associated protein